MSLAPQRSHACNGPISDQRAPMDRHVNSYLRSLVQSSAIVVAFLLAGVVPARADIVELRPAASKDDAEERADLSMYTGSSDLELVFDGSNQTVGLRFAGVSIPKNAAIATAWIKFQADEAQSEAAVVSPLMLKPSRMMTPAPRKPMPVTMP